MKKKKQELINWIKELDNETIIHYMLTMKRNTTDKDFWLDLPPEVQQELNEATKQLDAGDYLSHEEVMQKVKERFYE